MQTKIVNSNVKHLAVAEYADSADYVQAAIISTLLLTKLNIMATWLLLVLLLL